MMRGLSLAVVLGWFNCGGVAQQEINYPLRAVGTPASIFQARNGWQVELTQALVSLGPVYFCATQAASADLCPVAQAEFPQAATFNALDGSPQELGTVHGFTGDIGSAQYDFGISWSNTSTQPQALDGAVGRHSAHFEGVARKEGQELRFVADVDVVPRDRGTHVVQGARTGASISDGDVQLVVKVDPRAWWMQVNFDSLAQPTDDVVNIPPDSPALNAVIIGMTANAAPTFEWREP